MGGENVAGRKLKEAGTTHWNSPNDATNESGFSALPGGYRYSNGEFHYIGDYGNWWSSTVNNSATVWYRAFYYNYSGVTRYYLNWEDGFSVRCVRDD